MGPEWLALVSALGGGVVLKIVEWLLNSKKARQDYGASIRDELRKDVQQIRDDRNKWYDESQRWEERYWELKASTLMINNKVEQVGAVVEEHHPGEGAAEACNGPI